MLLLTIIYDDSIDDLASEAQKIKQYFELRDIKIGFGENIEDKTHILKIFCEDDAMGKKNVNMFNMLIANLLYKLIIQEYYKEEITEYISETYFFISMDDVGEIRKRCTDAFFCEGTIEDDCFVYCLNRKNTIIDNIILCVVENSEINVNGFLTFRKKQFLELLDSIVDKVIEKYMAEKEYNEFVKLLKYFVEIQESKIEEINIIIDSDGNYYIQDKDRNDIFDSMMKELSESKHTGCIGMEDIIISGLITNCPDKIIIHSVENCRNKEFIDTIKNVFGNRVSLCNKCNICKELRNRKVKT